MGPLKDDLKPFKGNPIERLLVALSKWALLLMGTLVGLNVLSRALSFEIIPDTVLLIKELMIYVIVLPLSYLAAQQDHISVTVFTEKVGHRGKLLLSLVSNLVGLIFSLFMVGAGWRLISRSIGNSEYYYGTLQIPQWAGHSVFLIGFLLLALRLLYMTLENARDIVLNK